jgi:hypothetical protein
VSIITGIVRCPGKILLDYLNASTINESYRLKKKRVKYEEKIKDVIKVEQLQTQLANRIIEEESIKQQVKKLQLEKESEALSIAAKYEKDIRDMREQMSRIMSMIQQNSQLAYIKPEALTRKNVGKAGLENTS